MDVELSLTGSRIREGFPNYGDPIDINAIDTTSM